MKNVAIISSVFALLFSFGCGGDEFSAGQSNISTGGSVNNTGGENVVDAGGSSGNVDAGNDVINTGGTISNTGGTSTGGNNTGGIENTGGTNTGGMSTGGNNTGGTVSTGGTAGNGGGGNNTGGSAPNICAGQAVYNSCAGIWGADQSSKSGMYCLDKGLGFDPINVYCDFGYHPTYMDGPILNDYGYGFALVYHSSTTESCTKESISLNVGDIGYVPISHIANYLSIEGTIIIVKNDSPFIITEFKKYLVDTNLKFNKNLNDKLNNNAWIPLNGGLALDYFVSGPLTDSYPDIFSVNYQINDNKQLKVTTNANGGPCASTYNNQPVDIKVFVK